MSPLESQKSGGHRLLVRERPVPAEPRLISSAIDARRNACQPRATKILGAYIACRLTPAQGSMIVLPCRMMLSEVWLERARAAHGSRATIPGFARRKSEWYLRDPRSNGAYVSGTSAIPYGRASSVSP